MKTLSFEDCYEVSGGIQINWQAIRDGIIASGAWSIIVEGYKYVMDNEGAITGGPSVQPPQYGGGGTVVCDPTNITSCYVDTGYSCKAY